LELLAGSFCGRLRLQRLVAFPASLRFAARPAAPLPARWLPAPCAASHQLG